MKKTMLSFCVAAVVGLLTSVSSAQMGGGGMGPGGGMGGGMGPGGMGGGMGGGMDRAAMEERMAQMMQEQLEISAEDWKVIGPRLTKVQTLQRESGMGGMGRGMMGMGRGNRGGGMGGGMGPGGPAGAADAEQTPVQKATADLTAVLEKADASADEIKAKLTALRAAREKSKQELIKAQEDLKKVLSVKQEARIVIMGLLD